MLCLQTILQTSLAGYFLLTPVHESQSSGIDSATQIHDLEETL